MSVQRLSFAEPFFSVDYIENEEQYYVEKKSMIINLSERSQKIAYIKSLPIMPLKAAVIENTVVENIGKALVVKDFMRCNLNDITVVNAIKNTWPSLYEMSGLPRHKDLPYYKSPKFKVGEGSEHIEINFCFVDEPWSPSKPHKAHDRNFDEVHAQIRGYGKMRIFEDNDYRTCYRELNMAPGTVHDRLYDSKGNYPWHEYQSVTPCIYCPIELDR